MTLTDTVLEGRAAAEELMTDTCTISRADSGEPVYDPATDTYARPAATTVYSGKCRVRPADTVDLAQEAGETVVGVRRYVASVPITVTGVRADDVAQVTASVLDPALVGARFRILGVTRGSQVTARRLACEEAGWVALVAAGLLLTEASDILTTESGDALAQEAA